MSEPKRVELPFDREGLLSLRAGDAVLLGGPLYTARDATHERLIEVLERDGCLPFGLEGHTLFYAGPTPPRAGRAVGAIGPTTAKRMDAWTPRLLEAGIVATIGKGPRSAAVRDACARSGALYLAAIGGAAALLATHVQAFEVVAWPELGTEALARLVVRDLPVIVAIDAHGQDLFEQVRSAWRGDVASR